MRCPRRTLLAVVAATLSIAPEWAAAADQVNLYSARKEELIAPLLERFTEETGIRINLVTGEAHALLARIENEGANSPSDLLITVDAGNLHRAKEAGVTQAIAPAELDAGVPDQYRDGDGHWVALSLRARPILYVEGRVDPADLSTYEALADPRWRGKICIRSSDNIYNQSLVASLIAADGAAQTEDWARGLVTNLARPPQGGDRDQIKAAAAGLCDLAIANTYYLAGMLASGDAAERAAAERLAVFWPNQDGRGVHVNVSGVALAKFAKNREAAIRLVRFLLSPEAQRWYAEVNGEYPVVPGVPASGTLAVWGPFKADAIALERLGELNGEAVRLMDRAGWP